MPDDLPEGPGGLPDPPKKCPICNRLIASCPGHEEPEGPGGP